MHVELPGLDDPVRSEIQTWLGNHPDPTARDLAEAGLVAPHWPRPYGRDAGAIEQLVLAEELKAANVRMPQNQIGIGWAGPTLVEAGTQDQKDRYLLPLLAGEEIWCQLFSEPEAGSDLASITTSAVADGDEWVINGQKVWTSGAQWSSFGILIARTDVDAPKRHGITYFICPMDLPGIEVRPLREMTGDALFNEVFLTDVRLSAGHVVGEVNQGWKLAKVTLGNERVSLSGGGALWGHGPTAADLIELVRSHGGLSDPHLRQRAAQLFIESEVLRLIQLQMTSAMIAGQQPGPEASVKKLLADEHGQAVMAFGKELVGAAGMLDTEGPCGADAAIWNYGYLFARALTIGGGTTEVQRNILAERVLGLPSDLESSASPGSGG